MVGGGGCVVEAAKGPHHTTIITIIEEALKRARNQLCKNEEKRLQALLFLILPQAQVISNLNFSSEAYIVFCSLVCFEKETLRMLKQHPIVATALRSSGGIF